jgi:hypothetical protein
MDGGVSFGQYSLYLVKIERAFEINNIQRDYVTCDIDETQLSRSFGEGVCPGKVDMFSRR